MSIEQSSGNLPEPEDLFMHTSLYIKFVLFDTESAVTQLSKIESFSGSFKAYCIECEKETVFRGYHQSPSNFAFNKGSTDLSTLSLKQILHNISDKSSPYHQPTLDYVYRDRVFISSVNCQLDQKHFMHFLFKVGESKLIKIGQFPSIADIEESEIKRYRKVLGNNRFREFSKAVGLQSHGIGIGSYVYLRRIFEGLIEEAHQAEKTSPGWDDTNYQQKSMADKIALLSHALPEFLVQNKKIYSILSIGIHELSEEDCLKYFPALKTGIELILDEKIIKAERAEKIANAMKTISAINPKTT